MGAVRRWGIGLGALALVSCGVVLSWGVPDEVAWTVLVALSPDERPVEVGPLRTGEALATTAVDLDARVLALGFTAEAVAALGAEVPVDAVLVPTADPCAPRFAAPTWARRTQGDGTVPVDADPAFAPELTADWLPPHCAEGNLCMGGQCEPRVAEVAIGRNHACARRADGKVACWGDNQLGQVGVSVEPFVTRATEVVGVEGALQLGLGSHHTCARVEGGKVSCWGANGAGQLGDGALRDRRTPDLVPGIEGALDLATGDGHNCALLGPDDVRCWGSNDSGQLGDGGEAPGTTPVRVEGLTGVRRLAAGNAHTCALQAGGVVTCWGDGTLGQLGPRGGRGPGPARVLEKDAEALAAGEAHTCARLAGGEVLCWGDDGAGQLGGGSPPLLAPAVGVAAGGRWTCATLEDGRMQCWGDNPDGPRGPDPLLLYSRDR
ncbi:MAG: hypothetical protein KC933_40405, partial [Myxococcales bacterium]|nr:hypothetical protein [Myxococcales bacterium]